MPLPDDTSARITALEEAVGHLRRLLNVHCDILTQIEWQAANHEAAIRALAGKAGVAESVATILAASPALPESDDEI